MSDHYYKRRPKSNKPSSYEDNLTRGSEGRYYARHHTYKDSRSFSRKSYADDPYYTRRPRPRPDDEDQVQVQIQASSRCVSSRSHSGDRSSDDYYAYRETKRVRNYDDSSGSQRHRRSYTDKGESRRSPRRESKLSSGPSDLNIDALLQNDRVKNVLLAGISKAAAKLNETSRSRSPETVAYHSKSSKSPSQVLTKEEDVERAIIFQKGSTYGSGKIHKQIDSSSAISSIKKALNLFSDKTQSSRAQSDKTGSGKSQASDSSVVNDDGIALGNSPDKGLTNKRAVGPYDEVQEQLYAQWQQSLKPNPGSSKLREREKSSNFADKVTLPKSKRLPHEVEKKEKGAGFDYAVNDILQAVGFNADLSRRVQELARKKNQEEDNSKRKILGKLTSLLHRDEDERWSKDTADALRRHEDSSDTEEAIAETRRSISRDDQVTRHRDVHGDSPPAQSRSGYEKLLDDLENRISGQLQGNIKEEYHYPEEQESGMTIPLLVAKLRKKYESNAPGDKFDVHALAKAIKAEKVYAASKYGHSEDLNAPQGTAVRSDEFSYDSKYPPFKDDTSPVRIFKKRTISRSSYRKREEYLLDEASRHEDEMRPSGPKMKRVVSPNEDRLGSFRQAAAPHYQNLERDSEVTRRDISPGQSRITRGRQSRSSDSSSICSSDRERSRPLKRRRLRSRDRRRSRSPWKRRSRTPDRRMLYHPYSSKWRSRSRDSQPRQDDWQYSRDERSRSSSRQRSPPPRRLQIHKKSSAADHVIETDLEKAADKGEVLYLKEPQKKTGDPNIIEISGSSGGKVLYDYIDAGEHWCSPCRFVYDDMQQYLKHCHGDKHLKNIELLRRPWNEGNIPDQSATLNVGLAKERIKGMEMLCPVIGFYCTLCRQHCADFGATEKHMKSAVHNSNYTEFTRKYPNYEDQLLVEKTKVLEERKAKRVSAPGPVTTMEQGCQIIYLSESEDVTVVDMDLQENDSGEIMKVEVPTTSEQAAPSVSTKLDAVISKTHSPAVTAEQQALEDEEIKKNIVMSWEMYSDEEVMQDKSPIDRSNRDTLLADVLCFGVDEFRRLQREDQTLAQNFLKAQKGHTITVENIRVFFQTFDNVLFYCLQKNAIFKFSLVVPQESRLRVLDFYHCPASSGSTHDDPTHLSVKETIRKINENFYWPSLPKSVRTHCAKCVLCQELEPEALAEDDSEPNDSSVTVEKAAGDSSYTVEDCGDNEKTVTLSEVKTDDEQGQSSLSTEVKVDEKQSQPSTSFEIQADNRSGQPCASSENKVDDKKGQSLTSSEVKVVDKQSQPSTSSEMKDDDNQGRTSPSSEACGRNKQDQVSGSSGVEIDDEQAQPSSLDILDNNGLSNEPPAGMKDLSSKMQEGDTEIKKQEKSESDRNMDGLAIKVGEDVEMCGMNDVGGSMSAGTGVDKELSESKGGEEVLQSEEDGTGGQNSGAGDVENVSEVVEVSKGNGVQGGGERGGNGLGRDGRGADQSRVISADHESEVEECETAGPLEMERKCTEEVQMLTDATSASCSENSATETVTDVFPVSVMTDSKTMGSQSESCMDVEVSEQGQENSAVPDGATAGVTDAELADGQVDLVETTPAVIEEPEGCQKNLDVPCKGMSPVVHVEPMPCQENLAVPNMATTPLVVTESGEENSAVPYVVTAPNVAMEPEGGQENSGVPDNSKQDSLVSKMHSPDMTVKQQTTGNLALKGKDDEDTFEKEDVKQKMELLNEEVKTVKEKVEKGEIRKNVDMDCERNSDNVMVQEKSPIDRAYRDTLLASVLSVGVDEFRRLQREDQTLKQNFLKAQKGHTITVKDVRVFFQTFDNVLFCCLQRKDTCKFSLVVPKGMRLQVLDFYHCPSSSYGSTQNNSSHLSVKQTIQKIGENFYWPSLPHSVRAYCANCVQCRELVQEAVAEEDNKPKGISVIIKKSAGDSFCTEKDSVDNQKTCALSEVKINEEQGQCSSSTEVKADEKQCQNSTLQEVKVNDEQGHSSTLSEVKVDDNYGTSLTSSEMEVDDKQSESCATSEVVVDNEQGRTSPSSEAKIWDEQNQISGSSGVTADDEQAQPSTSNVIVNDEPSNEPSARMEALLSEVQEGDSEIKEQEKSESVRNDSEFAVEVGEDLQTDARNNAEENKSTDLDQEFLGSRGGEEVSQNMEDETEGQNPRASDGENVSEALEVSKARGVRGAGKRGGSGRGRGRRGAGQSQVPSGSCVSGVESSGDSETVEELMEEVQMLTNAIDTFFSDSTEIVTGASVGVKKGSKVMGSHPKFCKDMTVSECVHKTSSVPEEVKSPKFSTEPEHVQGNSFVSGETMSTLDDAEPVSSQENLAMPNNATSYLIGTEHGEENSAVPNVVTAPVVDIASESGQEASLVPDITTVPVVDMELMSTQGGNSKPCGETVLCSGEGKSALWDLPAGQNQAVLGTDDDETDQRNLVSCEQVVGPTCKMSGSGETEDSNAVSVTQGSAELSSPSLANEVCDSSSHVKTEPSAGDDCAENEPIVTSSEIVAGSKVKGGGSGRGRGKKGGRGRGRGRRGAAQSRASAASSEPVAEKCETPSLSETTGEHLEEEQMAVVVKGGSSGRTRSKRLTGKQSASSPL
ncbi:uncharacterized protein LOC101851604 [Aplysia californica]|uniref:Uncharacterized protein LOC101851604 n=1 Tax=Aplysia californica TaxID=6500 RepID=A0ABM0K2K4_APLCA|nr:uncharacterized protein LOC101851604 [Aplysia californica]